MALCRSLAASAPSCAGRPAGSGPTGRVSRDGRVALPLALRLRDGLRREAPATCGMGQPARRPQDSRRCSRRARRTVATTSPSGTPRWRAGLVVGQRELRLPLPGFAEAWQTFVFLDGGRVWTLDRRFARRGRPGAGRLLRRDRGGDQLPDGGGGGSWRHKLNLGAGPAGAGGRSRRWRRRPATDARPAGRRLHLHFAIGSTF
jgi:hypothetical protein